MNVWDESPLAPPKGAPSAAPGVPASGQGGSGNVPPPPTTYGPTDEPNDDGPGDDGPGDAGGDEPVDQGKKGALFQRHAGIPTWLLLAFAVAIWIGVAAALILPGGSDDDTSRSVAGSAATAPDPSTGTTLASPTPTLAPITNAPTTTLVTVTNAPDPSDTGAAVTTDPPATTAPAPIESTAAAPPTTEPDTTEAPATTAPPETTAPATTPTATTTTTPPTTTTTTTPPTTTTTAPPASAAATTTVPTIVISEPNTVVGADGQSLTVTPRRSECRYGPDCFVVSFTIDGFTRQPQEFVCEFSSGARYVFRFSSAGADPACSTLDVPDTIVVEVAGLRSEPVTISAGG